MWWLTIVAEQQLGLLVLVDVDGGDERRPGRVDRVQRRDVARALVEQVELVPVGDADPVVRGVRPARRRGQDPHRRRAAVNQRQQRRRVVQVELLKKFGFKR